jgi:hypothetical protein
MEAPDLRLNLTLDEKANCSGKMEIPGRGSVKLIKRGGTIWLKPSSAFWTAQLGPERGAAAAREFKGRYIKGPSQDQALGGKGLAKACDLDAFRTASGALSAAGPRWKRGHASKVDGHRSVPVTRTQGDISVRMHVSADGKPYPLRLERKAGRDHDKITLSRFNDRVPSGTPPGDRTVSVRELKRHFKKQQEPPSKSV